MIYKGLYLNLKESTTRRKLLNMELDKHNLSNLYERFESIVFNDYMDTKLTPTEIGCFKSHIEAIKLSLSHNAHIHILEDDISFSKVFLQVVEHFINSINEKWDIFFTSFTVPIYKPYYQFFLKYDTQKINFFDMSNMLLTGAHSYIINKDSKQKIIDLLEKDNFQIPVDLALRELINNNDLKAYSLYPFISTHNYMESTIQRDSMEFPMPFESISQRAFYRDNHILDTKELIINYAKQEGFKISPMSDLSSVLNQVLLMRDFISAKYKYKNRLN